MPELYQTDAGHLLTVERWYMPQLYQTDAGHLLTVERWYMPQLYQTDADHLLTVERWYMPQLYQTDAGHLLTVERWYMPQLYQTDAGHLLTVERWYSNTPETVHLYWQLVTTELTFNGYLIDAGTPLHTDVGSLFHRSGLTHCIQYSVNIVTGGASQLADGCHKE